MDYGILGSGELIAERDRYPIAAINHTRTVLDAQEALLGEAAALAAASSSVLSPRRSDGGRSVCPYGVLARDRVRRAPAGPAVGVLNQSQGGTRSRGVASAVQRWGGGER
jgi:hypothetical protein